MKNRKRAQLLIFIFVTLSFGCKKDDEFSCVSKCLIFKGSVVDSYTNSSIKDGEIKIYMNPHSSLGDDRIEKASTITDKNGNYEIRLEEHILYKKKNDWIVTCKKDGYLWLYDYDSGIEIENIDSTNFDTPIESSIKLIPSAKLNVELNVNLNLLSSFKYEVDYGTEPSEINILESGQFERKIIHQVAGDRYVYVTFFPGILTPEKDSILINSGESGTISYDY